MLQLYPSALDWEDLDRAIFDDAAAFIESYATTVAAYGGATPRELADDFLWRL